MHERDASLGMASGNAADGSSRDLPLEAGIVLTEGWYGVEELGGRRARWTKPRFAWRSPPKPIARFELSCWLPPEGTIARLHGVLERQGAALASFDVSPGANRLHLDVPPHEADGGDFVITLDSGWIPARTGLGPDVRELGVLVSSLDAAPASGRTADFPPARSNADHPPDLEIAPAQFLEFEERFRGPRELIVDRQRRYGRYFEGHWNVVDLGCGRGEFLEVLREAGGDGWGVDLNPTAVAFCLSRGLRAIEDDAISYLETVGEGTLDGIFCAQLIEHIPRASLLALLALANRKLRPGGRILLETVNPKCLTVFSDSFYLDPGHSRPIPPELLTFDVQTAGLEILETILRSPVSPDRRLPQAPPTGSAELDAALETWRSRLNTTLFSDRDYAILARRPS